MSEQALERERALWVENARLRAKVRELEALRDKWGKELESLCREIKEALAPEVEA